MITATQMYATPTAAMLVSNEGRQRSFTALVKNQTGGEVRIGGSTAGLTASTGFPWVLADGALSIDVDQGESIYVAAAATQTLHVLAAGQ